MAPTVVGAEPDAPEDFASPALRLVDSTTRCPICREHFVAPMLLTTCSHTFCSLCIHTHFKETRKCPQCGVDTDESRLRKDITLAQTVKAWVDARPALLQLQLVSAAPRPYLPVASTSRGKGSKSTSKAGRSPTSDVEISSDSDLDIVSRPPSRSYGTRSRTLTSTQDATANKGKGMGKGKGRAVVKAEDDDERNVESSDLEIIEVDQPKKGKEKGKERMNSSDPSDPNLIVLCPICSEQYRNSELSAHTGRCVGNRYPTTSAWSKLLGSSKPLPVKVKQRPEPTSSKLHADTEKRLPPTEYKNIKQKALEQLLLTAGLPTTTPAGADKMRTWKRRHAQWTVVFNANLALEPGDSQRKTASQLRKDLKAWEAAQDANIKVDLGSPAAYMKAHKSEFDDLIRRGRPPPPSTRPPLPTPHSSLMAVPDHSATDGDLSNSADDSSSSTSLSRLLPPPSSVPLSRKRPRSSSPFDPEGPKPSQRVREEIFIEEDVFAENSGPDALSLGAVMEDSAEGSDF